MILKTLVHVLPFLLAHFDKSNGNLAQALEDAPIRSQPQFHLGNSSLIADITYLKNLNFNDRKDALQELTRSFPTLYLSTEISELERDFDVIFGTWNENIQSDLALNLLIRRTHDSTFIYNTIESALKQYRLEKYVKIILFEFMDIPDGTLELETLRSKFKPLYPSLKLGVVLEIYERIHPTNITKLMMSTADLIEYPEDTNAVYVSYSIFENYIDSIFEHFIPFLTKATESPCILIKLELNLRTEIFRNDETLSRYLCVQLDLMRRISARRNVQFIIKNLAELQSTTGIPGLIQANLKDECLPAAIESITSATYFADTVSPYRWVYDRASTSELLNISMLFNKTYSNSEIVFVGIDSYFDMALYQVFVSDIYNISSIKKGLITSVIDKEESDALHDLLIELIEDEITVKAIYLTVPSLIRHLNFRQKATSETASFTANENGFQTMAKEFKGLLNQLNASLIIFFDGGDVVRSRFEYGPELLSNKKYSPVVIVEVLKISDALLWTNIFKLQASKPNFDAYSKLVAKLSSITAFLYDIGDLYPNVQQVLGIQLGFEHKNDQKTCEPKTGINSNEFLEIMYTWAQIHDIKITEISPFTTFTEDVVAYGRWSVVPFSAFELDKGVIDMEDSPCIKWNPFKIERSNYLKITGASVSLNTSLLYNMNSNAQLELIKIVAERFQELELLCLDDFATANETCLKDMKQYSITKQFELLQESHKNAKMYISIEQQNNIFESLNCFLDNMNVTNTSILGGIHISLNSPSKVDNFNRNLAERILEAIAKLRKRRIKLGVVIEDCLLKGNLKTDPLYATILNYAEYVVCDSTLESLESHPLNFTKVHLKVDLARTLNLKLQSQESLWRRKPKVMIRIGWPKPEILSLEEVNENFLKFFRGVSEITKAYGIPLFINGAIHSENSKYVGWWYGNLTNVSSIIERESEFMGFDTWRPKVPEGAKVDDSENPTLILWILVTIGVLFLFTISCVSVLIVRKNRQNNILSDADIEEFFEEELNDPYESNIERNVSKTKDRLKHDVPWKNLKLDKSNKIGSGQFGVVYATTLNDQKVAVKVSKERNKECVKSIMSEIKIMVFLGEHKHILNFVGAYTRELKKGIVCLVTEFCETGSLHSYLQSVYSNACPDNILLNNENVPPVSFVSIHELCRFCYEIASGMDFLRVKNVVHGDLSARNVLLDWQLCCKISDFGFSRKVQEYADDKQSYNEIVPWRWMSIEALSRLEFTTKSDVWSFGVTAWEIFTLGSLPYAGINWNETFVADLTEGLRLTKPSLASDEIFKTLTDCWSNDPSDRPNFSLLCEMFKRQCPSDYAKV
ncbi:unnamed protein product [Orchesella dallaii]|uniref:Protein kinase domain-containing protein n=1 Tax=Orchesella dallaii TaxID=48710 RepID=A0ABP1RQ40_9HEXA